ncbi:MAG: B12-binding domain-containing radical SAM protein [Lachnospiraceae bacterium]
MKVVLTAINAKYIHSNLAVYSLKAYAHSFCEDIQIVEYTINQQIDDILMDLYKKQPDVLCFSCYIWNLNYIEEIVRECGKIFPGIPIWLGGPEVSYDATDVLVRLPEVTGVIRGEGEETFRELVSCYEEKKSIKEIRGITYRSAQSGIVENEGRSVMDLSKVPFVYNHLELFQNKIIYYETSRGCPFSCSYCLSSIDKCLRFRDMKLVKEELGFFIEKEIPQVKFVDRTFNCNHERAMEIWSYIVKKDKGITNFHFEVAADLLNEEEIRFIEQMRPGLIQLEIGVQSTNERTIKEIRRTMDFKEVARIVKRINQAHNVHQHLDLIAGLPYEGLESFQESFNQVYALEPEQLQLGFLKVLKGSYMEQEKTAYGLVYKSRPPYEVLYTNWMSYGEILKLKVIEEMVEIYYNSGQFRHTLKELVKEFQTPYEFFEQLGNYYDSQELNLVSHSRISRYEILYRFIGEKRKGTKESFYRELLTYDVYLRENVKNRPEFAGESQVDKEIVREFYEREAKEHRYLQGYDQYDMRQLRKMTHMEKFTYQGREEYLLFDYQNRNPLNHEATVYHIRKKGI